MCWASVEFHGSQRKDLNQILSWQWISAIKQQAMSAIRLIPTSSRNLSCAIAHHWPQRLSSNHHTECDSTSTTGFVGKYIFSAICPGYHMQLDAQGPTYTPGIQTAGLNVFSGSDCSGKPGFLHNLYGTGNFAFGCVDTTSVQVIVNPAPALTLTPNQSICSGWYY